METREQKLKAIREAVCKLLPEIKVLEPGCKFKHNYDTWIVNCSRCDGGIYAFSCSGDAHYFGPEHVAGANTWRYKFDQFQPSEIEEDQIIGRPIQINDILRSSNNLLVLRGNGQLFYEGYFNNEKQGDSIGDDHWSAWDLSLPLGGQSEETIDLLYKIFDK